MAPPRSIIEPRGESNESSAERLRKDDVVPTATEQAIADSPEIQHLLVEIHEQLNQGMWNALRHLNKNIDDVMKLHRGRDMAQNLIQNLRGKRRRSDSLESTIEIEAAERREMLRANKRIGRRERLLNLVDIDPPSLPANAGVIAIGRWESDVNAAFSRCSLEDSSFDPERARWAVSAIELRGLRGRLLDDDELTWAGVVNEVCDELITPINRDIVIYKKLKNLKQGKKAVYELEDHYELIVKRLPVQFRPTPEQQVLDLYCKMKPEIQRAIQRGLDIVSPVSTLSRWELMDRAREAERTEFPHALEKYLR